MQANSNEISGLLFDALRTRGDDTTPLEYLLKTLPVKPSVITALFAKACEEKPGIAEWLLEYYLNTVHIEPSHIDALFESACGAQPALAERLLQYGPSLNTTQVLRSAVHGGSVKFARMALAAGAHLGDRERFSAEAMLYRGAARIEDESTAMEMLQVLVDHGVEFPTEPTDWSDYSCPTHMKVLRFLLEHGAALGCGPSDAAQLIQTAAEGIEDEKTALEMLQLLIDSGVRLPTSREVIPYRSKHMSVNRFLVEHGIKPRWDYFVSGKDPEMIALLLERRTRVTRGDLSRVCDTHVAELLFAAYTEPIPEGFWDSILAEYRKYSGHPAVLGPLLSRGATFTRKDLDILLDMESVNDLHRVLALLPKCKSSIGMHQLLLAALDHSE